MSRDAQAARLANALKGSEEARRLDTTREGYDDLDLTRCIACGEELGTPENRLCDECGAELDRCNRRIEADALKAMRQPRYFYFGLLAVVAIVTLLMAAWGGAR